MYVKSLGFRAYTPKYGTIVPLLRSSSEALASVLAMLQSFALCVRVTGVNHNAAIGWVRKSAITLPDAPQIEEIPEIAALL